MELFLDFRWLGAGCGRAKARVSSAFLLHSVLQANDLRMSGAMMPARTEAVNIL